MNTNPNHDPFPITESEATLEIVGRDIETGEEVWRSSPLEFVWSNVEDEMLPDWCERLANGETVREWHSIAVEEEAAGAAEVRS